MSDHKKCGVRDYQPCTGSAGCSCLVGHLKLSRPDLFGLRRPHKPSGRRRAPMGAQSLINSVCQGDGSMPSMPRLSDAACRYKPAHGRPAPFYPILLSLCRNSPCPPCPPDRPHHVERLRGPAGPAPAGAVRGGHQGQSRHCQPGWVPAGNGGPVFWALEVTADASQCRRGPRAAHERVYTSQRALASLRAGLGAALHFQLLDGPCRVTNDYTLSLAACWRPA